jgi:hypothetical protein
MRQNMGLKDWVKHLQKRWSGWISDRDMERVMRSRLSGLGYYGDTAEFVSVRLVAIQRPGWLQVFSFTVDARRANVGGEREMVRLFGLVRQDERYHRCEVEVFTNTIQRNFLYQHWTEDLIRLRQPTL